METSVKLDELKTRCREAGIPLTQHRIEIYRVLLSTNEHPSPDMIYHRLKDNLPTLSLATVYNNLGILDRLGLVKKINPLSNEARYDSDLSSHNHFICISCNTVEDIDSVEVNSFDIPDLPNTEHIILEKSIEFVGICKKCKKDTREEV